VLEELIPDIVDRVLFEPNSSYSYNASVSAWPTRFTSGQKFLTSIALDFRLATWCAAATCGRSNDGYAALEAPLPARCAG
jgi:hypothetical protein